MRVKRPLLIMRVDWLYPVTWYAGQNAFGEPTVTHDRAYAWRFTDMEEARAIVAMLRLDTDGVWSIVSDNINL